MINKFIFAFLTAFILGIAFVIIAMILGEQINWKERKEERHIHKKKGVYRTGGLAMILAFISAIIINRDLFISSELYGVMAASILLMIIGIWDDFREIRWKIQLFFQIAIAVMISIMGIKIYYITNPLTGGVINFNGSSGTIISVALIIAWFILVINSMNWLDGIDGLSGGTAFIGALTIFFLSLKPEVNQPPVAILAMILAGSVLSFLVFNFNPSKIMAGTAGSMFMGFSLAVLAIFSGTKIATALLVLAIPVIDSLWVVWRRWRDNKSIFKPDRNHLHHKLLELGWSQRKINLTFYSITAFIAIVALNTRAVGKSLTLLATAIVMLAALAWIGKKIKQPELSK